jgi:hypothetical protein
VVRLSVVRPCKGSSGTEVLTEPGLELDLAASADMLRGEGLEVTNARVLLVVRTEPQVTLYPSGRMLVSTDDLNLARERAETLLRHLGME